MKKAKINIFHLIFFVIVIVFLSVLIIFNLNQKSDKSSVWNNNLTIGSKSAPNTLVVYTDVICPHCADLNKAINSKQFQDDYIKSKKLFVEIRVVPALRTVSPNSIDGSESVYCAAKQDKFLVYYNALINKLSDDFFSKNIGTKEGGKMIAKLDNSYYVDIAKKAGLSGNKLADCLSGDLTLSEVNQAYNKATKILPYGSGVPYLVINNKFATSGFGSGYEEIKETLEAGGVN